MRSEFVILEAFLELRDISEDFIFAKLADIGNYTNWRSVPVTAVNLKDNTVKFMPVPFIGITWKLTYNYLDKIIICRYASGPLRGQGIWSVKTKNENTILVTYRMEVRGIAVLFDLFIRTSFFKKKHTRDILNIIKLAAHKNV